jgi:hypothetical protein
LCEPWIHELLGQGLISQENYKVKQRFYLHLLTKNKLEGKFVFSLIIELVDLFFLKEKSMLKGDNSFKK